MKRLNLFMSLVCIALALACVALFLYALLERHELDLSFILFFISALLTGREFWRRAKLPLKPKTQGSDVVETGEGLRANVINSETQDDQSAHISRNRRRRFFSITGIVCFMLSMWMVALFLYALIEEHEFAPFRLLAAVLPLPCEFRILEACKITYPTRWWPIANQYSNRFATPR